MWMWKMPRHMVVCSWVGGGLSWYGSVVRLVWRMGGEKSKLIRIWGLTERGIVL